MRFSTKMLPKQPDEFAPDGSEVRKLQRLSGGSMAHFTLPPTSCSTAVKHLSVEEIWFVLSGVGEMWRKDEEGNEEITSLQSGVSLTIPLGTSFQFRVTGDKPLTVVAITMPPWPTDREEAVPVQGKWGK